MSRLASLFSVTAFPLVMAAAVAATIALIDRGVPPPLAFLGPMAAGYLFVIVFEHVFPHHRSWNRPRKDIWVDARHAVVSGLLTVQALQPLLLALAVAVGGWLSRSLGSPLWPSGWPLALQLAFALVVGEFFMYWIHRLTHTVPLLWRFHATHHSAPRLYWLNAARFHPVDLALSHYSWFVPLVALGAGEAVIALYLLVTALHGIFQHANLELRLGPLNWVFSMAELHRWHHSRSLAESNRNYGQNLIVWDVVFGTRYLPADREPSADIGLADLPAFPMTYLAQLASPFRWAHIVEASHQGSHPSTEASWQPGA